MRSVKYPTVGESKLKHPNDYQKVGGCARPVFVCQALLIRWGSRTFEPTVVPLGRNRLKTNKASVLLVVSASIGLSLLL